MPWDDDLQIATFSAGKFWGVQFYFDQVPGVISTRVGYTGGHTESPTEKLVESQSTGHTESVEIKFEPGLVNYDTLLKHFFRIHDPTQIGGQGKYLGDQYRSEIYYHNEDQRIVAEIVMNQLKGNYKKPIITKLVPAGKFYEADSLHQKHTQTTGEGLDHIPYEPL